LTDDNATFTRSRNATDSSPEAGAADDPVDGDSATAYVPPAPGAHRSDKDEAKDVYEKFKKGEKLSTEDLMLLQKSGYL